MATQLEAMLHQKSQLLNFLLWFAECEHKLPIGQGNNKINSRSYNKKEIIQISVSDTNQITAAKYYLWGGPTGLVSKLVDNRFLLSLVPWKGASCRRRPWNQRLTTFT
jgi:hypothetical protein